MHQHNGTKLLDSDLQFFLSYKKSESTESGFQML